MKNFCDPKKLAGKINRASTINNDRFLFTIAKDGLIDHLLPIKRPLHNIFCYNPFFKNFALQADLQSAYPDSSIIEQSAPPTANGGHDAVIDFMNWHYVGDRLADLTSYHRSLKVGGFFQAVLLSGDGLADLEQSFLRAEMMTTPTATMRFFPRHLVSDLISDLTRAKFSSIIADSDHLTLTYNDPKKILVDARSMALTNSLANLPSSFANPKTLHQTTKNWLTQNPPPLALRVELLYLHAVKEN